MSKFNIQDFKNLGLLTQLGLIMIIPIVSGLYFGKWLDNKFNTHNIFLFIMIFLGVIIAFLNLFRYGMKGFENKSDHDEES